MLRLRLLVAALVLPLLTWIIFTPNTAPFFGFCLASLAVAVSELGGMVRGRGLPFRWPVVLAAVMGLGVAAGFASPAGGAGPFWVLAAALSFGTLLALLLWEVLAGEAEAAFPAVAAGVFSVLLLGGVGASVMLLRRLDFGAWWVAILFGCNWVFDAGAMLGGRWLGRTPLAPAISPHKTVEGVGVGLGVNAVVALAIYFTLLPAGLRFPAWGFAALAVALGLLAQVGDLAESMIKRWAGSKNSSDIIPGHGGVLDKMDSAIFTAPLLYAFALWWLR
jgi:phosphatidate cytidylyltransferase